MKITTKVFDDVLKSVRFFEDDNIGIKYGTDFPDLARIILASEEFKEYCLMQGMMAMLPLLNLQSIREKNPSPNDLVESAKENISKPQRESLAVAIYIGYKLGRRDAEIEQLEGLAGEQKIG